MSKKKTGKKSEKKEEVIDSVETVEEVVEKPKIFGNKTPKTIKVFFLKGQIKHRGRTQADYHFSGGIPVTITDPIDVKFFMGKAEKNPETWKVG